MSHRSHELLRRFTRFATAGAIGTAAHYALLVTLVEAHLARPGPAAAAGASLGAVVNYVLNYHYTFGRAVTHRHAVPRFFAVAALGALTNGGIVAVAVHWGVQYLLAQVLATLIVLVGGFAANSAWTFAGSSRHAHADDLHR